MKCHVRYRASQRDAWYYGCYNGYAVARPCAATVFDPPRVFDAIWAVRIASRSVG
ncbi:MAG: hypothetical protein II022_05640 [Muribaculaceae bacterium]|nr:hypothetical protein [Muribaculaceae bacterium]